MLIWVLLLIVLVLLLVGGWYRLDKRIMDFIDAMKFGVTLIEKAAAMQRGAQNNGGHNMLNNIARMDFNGILNQILKARTTNAGVSTTADNFYHERSDKFFVVNFAIEGESYNLIVPYNFGHIARMDARNVYVVRNDGTKVLIKHYPGAPWLVTAKDLDIKHFEVFNRDTNRTHITDSNPYELESRR